MSKIKLELTEDQARFILIALQDKTEELQAQDKWESSEFALRIQQVFYNAELVKL